MRNELKDAIPFAAQNLAALPDEARLDVRTVATILGCGVSTAWAWAANGTIPKPTKIGRTTRWRAGDIRRIAAGQAT